jgi:hypothetical protein
MSATAGSDRTHATGAISVRVWEPQPYDQPTDGPALVKIHVEEEFSGDIEGSGVVEFLQAERADGSASFVGIERVNREHQRSRRDLSAPGPGHPRGRYRLWDMVRRPRVRYR